MRKVCIEKQVYNHYEEKMKQWNKERKTILMCFTYITKRWDMADKLVDVYNPFLKDISNASTKKSDNYNLLGARVVDAGEADAVREVRHSNIAHDPRVMDAFAVLQKYGYVTWKSFILDFEQSLRPDVKNVNHELLPKYDEFTPRMKWSLIDYVNKLHTEEWKFEDTYDWWKNHYKNEIEKYVKSEVTVVDEDWNVEVNLKNRKREKSIVSRKGTMKVKGEFDLPEPEQK